MEIFRSGAEVIAWRERLRARGASLAFVPTMGALHQGHFSLLREAGAVADSVLVSVFVNPLQFASEADYRNYPRSLQEDEAAVRDCGLAQALFAPDTKEIFPEMLGADAVSLPELVDIPPHYSRVLCSPHRPGHFAGVAQVVERFFLLLKPEYAFFGWKDYQQAKIIEVLNQRRGWGVGLRFCPTVREKDGLALSSRNRLLNSMERAKAAEFPRILSAAAELISSGHDPQGVLSAARNDLEVHFEVEYLELLTAKDLKRWQKDGEGQPLVLAAAIYCGKVRLIDAMIITVKK